MARLVFDITHFIEMHSAGCLTAQKVIAVISPGVPFTTRVTSAVDVDIDAIL